MSRLVLLVFPVMLLSGCHVFAVQTASDEADAAAKLFQPQAGKAVVYFYQDPMWCGSLTDSANIIVDRKRVGVVAYERFCVATLTPGAHEFGVTSTATDCIYYAPHDITLEPGIHYMKQVWVIAYGPLLKVATVSEAQKQIRTSRLAAGPTALQDMPFQSAVTFLPYIDYSKASGEPERPEGR
jgi:hypothetical protein